MPVYNRSPRALLVLLLIYGLYGALVLSTGVPQYEIEAATQSAISEQAELLQGDDNAEKRTQAIEGLEKSAIFQKTFLKVRLLGGGPIQVLIGIGVVSSLLFLVVSVWGSTKADFAQLAGITVFAWFALVPQLLVQLLLISQLQVMRVETSLAALLPDTQAPLGVFLLLRALDPFEIWFWTLVVVGLCKTGQLTLRRALVVTLMLAFLGALTQTCLEAPGLVKIPPQLLSGEAEVS